MHCSALTTVVLDLLSVAQIATAFCSCVVQQKDVEDSISESLGHFSVSDKLGGRRSSACGPRIDDATAARDGVITQAGR